MVPTTRNLLHHDDGKSSRGRSCYHSAGQYYVGISAQLEASAAPAWQQDQRKPSRSRQLLGMADDEDEPAAAAGPGPGTSSGSPGGAGAGNGEEGDWLQLGLAAAAASASASSSGDNSSMDPDPPGPPGPMELELFAYDKRNARMRPPLFPLPLRSYHQPYGGGRGRNRPAAAASGSMSSAPFMPPFRCSGGDAIRVISPPRRTEAPGLWLTLQAAPNQIREPILPQIAKSYLRIKDSNMKVEVVMKYLAEKLGIARSRHQVELTCSGQVLPPFLLVRDVRETIWCSTAAAPREEGEETPSDHLTARRRSSDATDHVMTLCYSTSRNCNAS